MALYSCQSFVSTQYLENKLTYRISPKILYMLSYMYGKDLGKVGRSKPPLVLTGGFNRLKPPRSICQKVVNTGQYESEWSIENFMGLFKPVLHVD